ncbi:MAG TPA: PilZ domain-containing protein, partial [Thermodesulfovibrionales bacterium]|nr:PilZ domain-containing protein [Thermodesulfovibrionales bacterium]
ETLCSLIRDDEELRNVSLILVCSASESDLERCVQCRANVFIASPINSAVLLQEAYQLLHIAPRKSCRISMSVKLEGRSKEVSFIGFIENISASGMLFRTSALLSEGDSVQCSFSLPDSARINANAEIMRVLGKEAGDDASRYGIRFTDPGVDLISAIETLIEKEYQCT